MKHAFGGARVDQKAELEKRLEELRKQETVLPMTKVFDGETKNKAGWIIRGTVGLSVTIGGVRLPATARLRLHRLERYNAKPLEEFVLCHVSGSGALYQVTLAVEAERRSGTWEDQSYQEGCVRAGKTPRRVKAEEIRFLDLGRGSACFHKSPLTPIRQGQSENAIAVRRELAPNDTRRTTALTTRGHGGIVTVDRGSPPECAHPDPPA